MKIGALLLVGWMAACFAPVSPSVPTARLGSAEEAVNEAAREGAREHPRAARQLRLAETEIARARASIRQGEYQQAESLLTRAEADAEVAKALAREAQVWTEANTMRTHVASSGRTPPDDDSNR